MAGKFIADSMLGSLARRLRMLGIDTAYCRDSEDGALKSMARAEGRILLSRDRRLVRAIGKGAWEVTGTGVREEFLSVAPLLAAEGCRPAPMSRCLECNGRLITPDSASARAKAPPHVLESGADLLSCAGCGKVYWKGTHGKRMDEEVAWMKGELEKRRRPGEG